MEARNLANEALHSSFNCPYSMVRIPHWRPQMTQQIDRLTRCFAYIIGISNNDYTLFGESIENLSKYR